jgi:hypothetical protein
MSKEEIKKEKQIFANQYSLEFMIEDNVDLQDVELMSAVIHREVTKTKSQKIEDYCTLDGNLILWCETVNGYM